MSTFHDRRFVENALAVRRWNQKREMREKLIDCAYWGIGFAFALLLVFGVLLAIMKCAGGAGQ